MLFLQDLDMIYLTILERENLISNLLVFLFPRMTFAKKITMIIKLFTLVFKNNK